MSKNTEQFKVKMRNANKRAATSPLSYQSYGRRMINTVRDDFSYEEILDIIRSGDNETLRELSRFYYRTNGLYRNNVELLATLLKYDTLVVPVYNKGKKISKLAETFYKACNFVDALNIPLNFCRITREMIISGVYYGILREGEGVFTIQDLPIGYCRTRFKDLNGLDILEFNLNYFLKITDEKMREEAILSFPKKIQQAWTRRIKNPKAFSEWVEIYPEEGGLCFSTGDRTPLLITAIPSLFKMNEAVDRESKRDENELYKILIQRMPTDSQGQLIFELEEIADIHESVADMLKDEDTIEVLTTLGETKLENVQDSSAASQSADRIEKYKNTAFDALGRSSILFNSDGSSSLAYSIQRDEALMLSISKIYSSWIKLQINKRYAKSNLSFDFEILPTTIFNQEKIQKQYFQGAQYGYSKMYAGAALGIKQSNQLSLMDFEGEVLKMHDSMIPLRSSYTTSGKEEEKEGNTTEQKDLLKEEGRPSMDATEISEKTEANQATG